MGKFRSAVRWITDREKVGVFQPAKICPKTGKPVLYILHSKHPGARSLTEGILEAYRGNQLALVPVDISNETVVFVTRRLLRAAGPGRSELFSIQHWLLQFGAAGSELGKIIGKFGEWMSNRCFWASYRALMLGRIIGLEKCPGIRPVRVG